jgi:hypothetical protein
MADKQAWRQSAQELAAGNAAADSVVAAGGARRSLDVVAAVAADSRCPTRCRTRSRPGWRVACVSATSASKLGQSNAGLTAPGWELGGPGLLNTITAGQLIHMLDQISNRRFLVDTGASYSILPHRPSLPATGHKLFGLAWQLIPCWGDRLVQLRSQDQDFS